MTITQMVISALLEWGRSVLGKMGRPILNRAKVTLCPGALIVAQCIPEGL